MKTEWVSDRVVSELDHVRLSKLIERQSHEVIEEVLEGADVIAPVDVPKDLVTMRSRVTVSIEPQGEQRSFTLCYPHEDVANGLSVLSPMGSSLLGLRVGAVARWQTPNGEAASAKVLAILFQPEATGEYAL